MAWQLIYTSSPRGLTSGQSGFCTVARSADLREAVAQRLEQLSSYHYLQLSSSSSPARNPTISAYRVLDIRGTKYHALTRIQPSGLDFTARTNHLAQHLVLQADEVARLPSPASILRHWNGWLSSWQGDPRLLSALTADAFKQVPPASWPAAAWLRLTGDAGRAAALLEAECVRGCYLLCPDGGEKDLLELFCETLQLPNYTGKYPLRAWQHTFTTFLQAEDAVADFQWRGCQAGTPAHLQAVRRSAPLLELRALRIPNNPLAKLAREGPKPPSPAPAAPAAPLAPLTLRRDPPGKATVPSPAIDFSQTEYVRRSTAAPKPVGLTISIRKTSLVALGIALALLGGLFAIQQLHRTGQAASSRPPADPGLAPRADGSPPIKTPLTASNAGPAVTEATVSTAQLEKELEQIHLGKDPAYLVVVPTLDAANLIRLPRIEPLEQLLGKLSRIDLVSTDLDMRCCQNNWGLPVQLLMNVSGSSPPHEYQLSGECDGKIDPSAPKFTLNYSAINDSTNCTVTIETKSPEPLKAFWVLFQPKGKSKNFDAFRLLVVHGNDPPGRLELNKHFLDFSAASLPQIFREPLNKWFRCFELNPPASWHLQPFVGPKGKEIELYDGWPSDEKPAPEAELDFAAARARLEQMLKGLTDEADRLTKEMSNVDLSLPLGSLLNLTGDEPLLNFDAYMKNSKKSFSEGYRDYLEQIEKQGEQKNPWIKTWSVPPGQVSATNLDQLYVLFTNNIPASTNKLTVADSTPNRLIAVWKNLHLADDLRKKTEGNSRTISELRKRLDQIPRSLDQAAYISLSIIGPNNRPLEMIRFSGSSAAN